MLRFFLAPPNFFYNILLRLLCSCQKGLCPYIVLTETDQQVCKGSIRCRFQDLLQYWRCATLASGDKKPTPLEIASRPDISSNAATWKQRLWIVVQSFRIAPSQ